FTYAVVHIPAGFIADRFSVRMIYAMAVGLWSLAGAAAAWGYSARGVAGTRAVLGAREAVNWPCGLRVTADMLPREDRALGNGVFNSGSALGALIAPLLITPIANRYGWRRAFLLIGALGIAWIVIWLIATRRMARRHPVLGEREQ